MALDEPRRRDEQFDFGLVHIVVDQSSQVYMEEKITIDFDGALGAYRLKSPERIIPGYYQL